MITLVLLTGLLVALDSEKGETLTTPTVSNSDEAFLKSVALSVRRRNQDYKSGCIDGEVKWRLRKPTPDQDKTDRLNRVRICFEENRFCLTATAICPETVSHPTSRLLVLPYEALSRPSISFRGMLDSQFSRTVNQELPRSYRVLIDGDKAIHHWGKDDKGIQHGATTSPGSSDSFFPTPLEYTLLRVVRSELRGSEGLITTKLLPQYVQAGSHECRIVQKIWSSEKVEVKEENWLEATPPHRLRQQLVQRKGQTIDRMDLEYLNANSPIPSRIVILRLSPLGLVQDELEVRFSSPPTQFKEDSMWDGALPAQTLVSDYLAGAKYLIAADGKKAAVRPGLASERVGDSGLGSSRERTSTRLLIGLGDQISKWLEWPYVLGPLSLLGVIFAIQHFFRRQRESP